MATKTAKKGAGYLLNKSLYAFKDVNLMNDVPVILNQYSHIPSKTSRSTSSVPWITPEIRRKIRRRNKTHAKAKKTGSSKLRAKFESLRKEIKASVGKMCNPHPR